MHKYRMKAIYLCIMYLNNFINKYQSSMKSELSKFYPIQIGGDNQILRRKSEKITEIDDNLIEFWNILLSLMYENDWVWLAAPQIWENIRMIAVTSRKDTKKWQEIASETIMINPEIIEKSPELVDSKEACLSIPNIVWLVKRHKNITIEYFWLDWHKRTKKLRDYNAFIVQHEIDHLDGILFTDKMYKQEKDY